VVEVGADDGRGGTVIAYLDIVAPNRRRLLTRDDAREAAASALCRR